MFNERIFFLRSPFASVLVAKEVDAITSIVNPEKTSLTLISPLPSLLMLSKYDDSLLRDSSINGFIPRSFDVVKAGLQICRTRFQSSFSRLKRLFVVCSSVLIALRRLMKY